jgi:hypothetical protein
MAIKRYALTPTDTSGPANSRHVSAVRQGL